VLRVANGFYKGFKGLVTDFKEEKTKTKEGAEIVRYKYLLRVSIHKDAPVKELWFYEEELKQTIF
jgi:hypothetical protein